ncbi:MAG: hypothetical protein ACTS6J_20460 [Burkholderiales bacterium]
MDELQHPDAAARGLLGKKVTNEMRKRLPAIQQQHSEYTLSDTALAAITGAVNFIMIESAGKVFAGENMVIRDCSSSDELKKAAMCYAFGLLIFTTLLAAFLQAGVVSTNDKVMISGRWRNDLLAGFMLASPEQKTEILRLGSKMFQDLKVRRESNVTEFLETLEQLTLLTAMNWETKKTSEEVMLGMFKQKADVLLGALS